VGRKTQKKAGRTQNAPPQQLQNYFIPKRFLNLSTRPPVSTSFCLPVKKGWHFEQISTLIFSFVEPVSITLPQAQVIVVCL